MMMVAQALLTLLLLPLSTTLSLALHGPHLALHGPHLALHGPHLALHGPHLALHGPHLEMMEQQWLQWKTRYGKTYSDPWQEACAQALWLRHWHQVQSHNSRDDVTFTLELNAFADQELRRVTRTLDSHPLHYVSEVTTDHHAQAPPPSFDWRTKGVITPVRNQGQLGSSDAFAVTEDLESLHAIRTAQLVTLSVQEVTDCCSTDSGSMLVPDIYECISRHGGLCSEASYPPHAPPPVCRNDSCRAVAKDANKTGQIPKGNEDAMVFAVLKRPLVVRVDAGHPSFQLYKAGVYSDQQCHGDHLDHSLQLVGYGTEKTRPYWILKNSWGAAWGMQGYILMERGVNMCGVANAAIYPE